ncbi:g716 [Coccomyxa viridis]|uniref:protein-serine/threonine phosphatase n=1 Tax=Coccomyxa viridis TaxID=1274662 RepID=A0ABP1FLS1_9CHLO
MGAYLSAPVTEKASDQGENETFRYGVCAMQGWRTEMEDAHSIVLDLDTTKAGFFGVFDGHGGKEVAKFSAVYLAKELLELPEFRSGNMPQALGRAFLRMDELLVEEKHLEELKTLAGPKEKRRSMNAPLVMDEAELPEVLREALKAARERMADKRARRARGEAGDDEDDDDDEEFEEGDEISMTDMAQLIAVDSEEDEEDDPDYEPLSMEEDSIQAQEMKVLEIDSAEAKPDHGKTDGGKKVNPGPPSHALLEIGDEASVGNISEPMDEGQPQQSAETDEAASKKPLAESAARNGGKRKRIGVSQQGAIHSANGVPGTSEVESSSEEMVGQEPEEASGRSSGAEGSSPTSGHYTGPSAGCTAVVALVRGTNLWVANAGDSRCVASRRGRALALTHDHKPTDSVEMQRIAKAGGFVAEGRINGSLNLSRALGDMDYKQSKDLGPNAQMVIAVPEVRHLKLEEGDEFLILACDGIWDVLSNQEAVDFVRKRLARRMAPQAICEAMCDHCLAPDTQGCGKGCDNMSAVVVVLKPFSPFTKGDHEIDLNQLPPPPPLDDFSPEFHDSTTELPTPEPSSQQSASSGPQA